MPNPTESTIVIAMGFVEDKWNSMRILSQNLFAALNKDLSEDNSKHRYKFHAPICGHSPSWFDRRIRYPLLLPEGKILHLMDQSYGDALLSAGGKYTATSVVIHDLSFWRDRSVCNYWIRRKIVDGLKKADIRIADSYTIATEAKNKLGLPIDAVITPGVCPDTFQFSEGVRDRFLLLHVGATSHRKGFDRLLRLLSCLPEPYRLYQVGGRTDKAIEKMKRQLGVENRIVHYPYLELSDLVKLYQRAWALIFPSRYEGFGLPVIEARLCGTPVLLSSEVPAAELLSKDTGTVLVDFNVLDREKEPNYYNTFCSQLLSRSNAAIPLQDRGHFSWARAARDYASIFRKLSN